MGKSDTTTITTESPGAHRRHDHLLRLATTWSVATAAVLIVVKAAAALLTGSVSIVASLVDSVMDALASLGNFFAVRYALRPPDEEHRFGHGKAEALAGLGQAAFIAGSAVFLLLQALDRLIQPRPIEAVSTGIWVMAFAIAATLVLLGVQRYVVRETGSLAIRADSLHYLSDLLANGGVILALVLATRGFPQADAVFALIVAGFILVSAWQIGAAAVQTLLDRELPPAEQAEILRVACRHPAVADVHDLRTRQAGPVRFIQLHLELPGTLSLARAHAVADEVAGEIKSVFPGADVIIHQDPAGLPEQDREPWRDDADGDRGE